MEKIKQFVESERGKDIFTVIIVILVGLGSFGLGRLSKRNDSAGIKVDYPDKIVSESSAPENQTANIISSTTPIAKSSEKKFFASNRGSKYYPVGCSAGKDLKMENRIYFETSVEAERAGYQLSGSCK